MLLATIRVRAISALEWPAAIRRKHLQLPHTELFDERRRARCTTPDLGHRSSGLWASESPPILEGQQQAIDVLRGEPFGARSLQQLGHWLPLVHEESNVAFGLGEGERLSDLSERIGVVA